MNTKLFLLQVCLNAFTPCKFHFTLVLLGESYTGRQHVRDLANVSSINGSPVQSSSASTSTATTGGSGGGVLGGSTGSDKVVMVQSMHH